MGRKKKEKVSLTPEQLQDNVVRVLNVCKDIPDDVKLKLIQVSKQIQTEEQYKQFEDKLCSLLTAWEDENFKNFDEWSCTSSEHDFGLSFGCEQGLCIYCTNPCERGVTDQSWLNTDDEECLDNFVVADFWEGANEDKIA